MPFLLLVAYATGIALVRFFAPGDITGLATASGLLCLGSLLFRRSPLSALPFLAMLLLSGWIHAGLAQDPLSSASQIHRFADDQPRACEARVISFEPTAQGGYRVYVEALRVFDDPQQGWHVSGRVLLSIKAGGLKAQPGQVVRWRSKLRRPTRFGNPGEFDYPLYLAARGIHATAFIPHTDELVTLANHPQQSPALLARVRLALAGQIRASVPGEEAGLLQSLLLGLRGGISPEQRKVLAGSGIAHLFAISGLHFGLLAMLLYLAGHWLYTRSHRLVLWCPPQRLLPILLLIPLAGYLLLTGNAWATRRAFLMGGLVTVLVLANRRTRPFSLLATVALCLLVCDPLALFQPGFQLSFTGVGGLLAWLPRWRQPVDGLPRPLRWVLMLLLTTLAASLATAPATLWHFHLFAPAGLVTNLLAIPLVACGAVPLGLAGLLILPVSALFSQWLLWLAGKLTTLVLASAASISQIPGLVPIQVYMTTSKLILLCGLLITCLPFGGKTHHWRHRLGILLLAVTAAALFQQRPAEFQVTAFSVGQGDATLLSFNGNRHYLIDGGGLPGSDFDPGERLIAPTLGRMGIDHLDGVILTHNHPDHAAGLASIVRHVPVTHFYLATAITDIDSDLKQALQQEEIPVTVVAEGWTSIHSTELSSLSLFVPDQSVQDLNERSIAIHADYRGEGVLLTADMGQPGLRQLLAAGIPGQIRLLKLPHHGSRNASPGFFLSELKPSLAFVSVGNSNPYGFPHRQAIDACRMHQVPLYRTDRAGLLQFYLDKGGWQVLTYRE